MWFIWWLLAWIVIIATYVVSWIVGFVFYGIAVLAIISGILSITGSRQHNKCPGSDPTCITQGNPPSSNPPDGVGPVSPPNPENPQYCAVKEAITAGAPLIRRYLKEQNNIDRLHNAIETAQQVKQTLNIKKFQQTLETVTKQRDETYQLLVSTLQQATNNCLIEQQTQALADFVKEANSNGETAPLVQFAEAFVSEAQAYQQTGVIDERLLKDTLPENTQ